MTSILVFLSIVLVYCCLKISCQALADVDEFGSGIFPINSPVAITDPAAYGRFLSSINAARAARKLATLSWNNELSTKAMKNASGCVNEVTKNADFGADEIESTIPQDSQHLRNTVINNRTLDFTLVSLVLAYWNMEKPMYDRLGGRPSLQACISAGCRHYWKMLNFQFKQIGCGIAFCEKVRDGKYGGALVQCRLK